MVAAGETSDLQAKLILNCKLERHYQAIASLVTRPADLGFWKQRVPQFYDPQGS